MKAALLLIVALCGSPFGMDQKNLTLKAGVRGGVPQGAGVSTRLTAYLFNLEGAVNYGYYVNTMQMGFGFRLPVGERNELFLNVGGVVYPEQNEVSFWYFFPALRVGVNREIFGL